MVWLRTEYILKGIFLGLLVFVAVHEPDWVGLRTTALVSVAGLAICLGFAAYQKTREGYSPRGRPFAYLLFLLLESPELVYTGVLLGMAVAAFLLCRTQTDNWLLAGFAATGAIIGSALGLLRSIERRAVRIGVGLLLAATVV